MNLASFRDILNKHALFSREEWVTWVITSVSLGYLFFLQEWSDVTLSSAQGFMYTLAACLAAGLILFVHHMAQRSYGLWFGVRTRFELWWYGLLMGIAFALITKGQLVFLAATGTVLGTDPLLRLGRFRKYADPVVYGRTVMAGPLAVLVFVAFLKTIESAFFPGSGILTGVVDKIFRFGIFFCAWNLFPIPPLDGNRILFGSMQVYFYLVAFFLAYVLLLSLFNIYSLALALVMGFLAIYIYNHIKS